MLALRVHGLSGRESLRRRVHEARTRPGRAAAAAGPHQRGGLRLPGPHRPEQVILHRRVRGILPGDHPGRLGDPSGCALKTAGSGSWFNVVERGYLDSLLRERKLIQDTYSFLKKDPRKLIDPLKFAEYIVTGGVVSYDSPIQTGSAAVTLGNYGGGLGGHKDLVTINIRIVRVRDGLVLKSINASRPIITGSATGNATRVLGRRILDAKGAIGVQEATQTAVREAIEAGVYELVRSGAATGLWEGRTFSPYGPDVAQTGSIKLSTGARPAAPAQAAKTVKAPDPGGPPQGAGTGATPPKPAQSAASAPKNAGPF